MTKLLRDINTGCMSTPGHTGRYFIGLFFGLIHLSVLAALEPLPVTLHMQPADEVFSVPPGFERSIDRTVENRVYALGRFDVVDAGETAAEPSELEALREEHSAEGELAEAALRAAGQSADDPGVHVLQYGILSYSEELVWVPYEDEDEQEEEESDDSLFGAILTFFFPVLEEENEEEQGRWMTEASVTLDVRLIAPRDDGRRSGGDKAFSTTAYALEESPGAAHSTLLDGIAASLDTELRRLYVLRGQSAVTGRRYGTIDFGDEVGVRSGQLFTVRSETAPGSTTLLRVVQVDPGSSDVRVVRQWGTRDASGAAREVIGPSFDVRVDGIVDISDDGMLRVGPALTIVAAPYAPIHGGGGMRFFGVEDSADRVDFGFTFSAFVGAHLIALPRFRLTAVGTGELGIVTRPDDNNDSASALVPAIAPELQASIVITPHLDLLLGGGYRFAASTTDWTVTPDVEDAEPVSAEFGGDPPSVTTTGPFAYAGMRFVVF